MDEILSSIRQIIADDDAAAAPRRPALPPAQTVAAAPVAAAPSVPIRPLIPPMAKPTEAEPLALTSEQILRETAESDMAASRAGVMPPSGARLASVLVDPEDITFDAEDEEPEMSAEPARPIAPPPLSRSAPPVARAAPLPNPDLTTQLAEQLLEPATQSAVKSTFSRLSNLSVVGSGLTLEELAKEMLRPMLKEWLDENLPAVVERMVEREISRVSRGGV